jgi:hypothetical protein
LAFVPGRPEWANFRLMGCWLFTLGGFLDTKVAQTFGQFFPDYKLPMYVVLTKMGWDIFWAIFSQTHLVTLL